MATLQVSSNVSFSINLWNLSDLYEGDRYSASSTRFQVFYDDGTSDRFRGTGFTYDANGQPISGTVRSYETIRFGDVVFRVTDLSISVPTLVKAASTGGLTDDRAVYRAALAGNDTFVGNSGNDVFAALGGQDNLFGRGGNDTLDGGVGRDLIVGGFGRDILIGGAGADRFRYTSVGDTLPGSRDQIRDFKRGLDKIDLSQIDADQDGTVGNQAFKFIGTKAFTGVDGQLRFAGGSVYGDVDGDTIADFAIRVANVSSMSASDFVL